MATTSATVTATDSGSSGASQSATSGCTSRAGRLRATPTSRSSPAARAPTSGTRTATATSTGSPRSSASTPATGCTELGDAAAKQVAELDFYTNWSYAHPRAIELAARIAALAPGDLNRVFFTNGGSEAVESAIKLARAYHQRTGNPRKTKFITREVAYHGTTLGALAATGISALRYEFEPLVPGGLQVPNTNSYHWPEGRDPLWAADQIEEKILFEDPDTVAAVILEPLQNAGGCIPPQEGYFQRVREICDRHNVLLVSDEVICAWGRLGH